MWAYLIGLGVLAVILMTSHLPRSSLNPSTFVDNDDQLGSGTYFMSRRYSVIIKSKNQKVKSKLNKKKKKRKKEIAI